MQAEMASPKRGARPPEEDDREFNRQMTFRLTEEQDAALQRIANAHGVGVGTLLRDAAVEVAAQVRGEGVPPVVLFPKQRNVRMTEEDYDALEAAAGAAGMTFGAYAREAALAYLGVLGFSTFARAHDDGTRARQQNRRGRR